ncbi:MAG: hypothetical protein WAX89_02385 [Alphaproteobacteria bacterium]
MNVDTSCDPEGFDKNLPMLINTWTADMLLQKVMDGRITLLPFGPDGLRVPILSVADGPLEGTDLFQLMLKSDCSDYEYLRVLTPTALGQKRVTYRGHMHDLIKHIYVVPKAHESFVASLFALAVLREEREAANAKIRKATEALAALT